jgi:hypothetical protein
MGRGIDRPNSAKSQESLQSNPDEHSTKISGFWKWTRSVYFFRCYYYSTTVFIGGKSDIFALGDYKYLATIERIFGWLFFGLFLATLTRTLLG